MNDCCPIPFQQSLVNQRPWSPSQICHSQLWARGEDQAQAILVQRGNPRKITVAIGLSNLVNLYSYWLKLGSQLNNLVNNFGYWLKQVT